MNRAIVDCSYLVNLNSEIGTYFLHFNIKVPT